MKSLEGRPVSSGLLGGIDTDDIPCTSASLSPPTYEEENKETNSERLSVPQCSDRRTEEQKTTKTKKKKQRKSVTYDELMESNLTLDNERLQLEICRIKKETEKLNEEVQLLQTKRLYLQLKMEKEFQLTPVFDESK